MELLKQLGTQIKSPASLMLLPYICLCCNEALSFMEYNLNLETLSPATINYTQVRSRIISK